MIEKDEQDAFFFLFYINIDDKGINARFCKDSNKMNFIKLNL